MVSYILNPDYIVDRFFRLFVVRCAGWNHDIPIRVFKKLTVLDRQYHAPPAV
jgi:hypothetical protein